MKTKTVRYIINTAYVLFCYNTFDQKNARKFQIYIHIYRYMICLFYLYINYTTTHISYTLCVIYVILINCKNLLVVMLLFTASKYQIIIEDVQK